MRPLLACLCACVAALAAAASGASEAAPAISVSVTSSRARTVAGSREPAGRRDYVVAFRVTARSEQQCANLLVEYSYAAFFDGRRSLAGSAIDHYETDAPASEASFEVHAPAGAADVVTFSGHAVCEDAAGDVIATSAVARARAGVAAHSCEQGPLRVFAVRGAVRREDLVSPARKIRVFRGHYLWTGYRVAVPPHGRLAFGATECRGLRVIVGGSTSFSPGDYSRAGYGTSTLLGYGAVADYRGDQHSGGVETANAAALPRGARTAASKLARFEIVSLPKRLGGATRIHVRRGAVYVAARKTGRRVRYGAAIVVRAGETTVVRCTPVCRPAAPTRR
jgi:hypothetical protein